MRELPQKVKKDFSSTQCIFSYSIAKTAGPITENIVFVSKFGNKKINEKKIVLIFVLCHKLKRYNTYV